VQSYCQVGGSNIVIINHNVGAISQYCTLLAIVGSTGRKDDLYLVRLPPVLVAVRMLFSEGICF
jgi:hypothetical protein